MSIGKLKVVATNVGGTKLWLDDEFGQSGGRDYMLASVNHGDPDELVEMATLLASAQQMQRALTEVEAMLSRVMLNPESAQTLKKVRSALKSSKSTRTALRILNLR